MYERREVEHRDERLILLSAWGNHALYKQQRYLTSDTIPSDPIIHATNERSKRYPPVTCIGGPTFLTSVNENVTEIPSLNVPSRVSLYPVQHHSRTRRTQTSGDILVSLSLGRGAQEGV